MPRGTTRRQFVRTGIAAGLGSGLGRVAFGQAPAVLTRRGEGPVVIASPNGHFYRNGGAKTGIETAFEMIASGSDVLDAVVAGVNIVELDPLEDSVGYGGLPNADGVVQLDSCCMHGPKRRAGGVAGLEGVRTPSRVARAVADQTDHHLLVGQGAQSFARQMGFAIEADLNTPHSRTAWLEWKRRTDPLRYPRPEDRARRQGEVLEQMVRDGILRSRHLHGTINCCGLSPAGSLCGVTTTSGLAWKIPGRVGDSPILGAGLYVADGVGAAGSTGRGEANLFNLSSYLIVEELRRGAHPRDAGMTAVKRIRESTVERRLQKPNGDPNFNVSFYILDARGKHAGVALYTEDEDDRGWAGQTDGRAVRYAVCDAKGPRLLACDGLLQGTPQE